MTGLRKTSSTLLRNVQRKLSLNTKVKNRL
jgi:hypothetical protein